MSIIVDGVVGAVVSELLSTIKEMIKKNVNYKSTLQELESTLTSIEPSIKEIDDLIKRLGGPDEETKKLMDLMESGKDLVLKCSKVKWFHCFRKADYQEELEKFHNSIRDFFNVDMQGHILKHGLKTEEMVAGIHARIMESVPSKSGFSNVCSPTKPPAFTIGFDVHLWQLKLRLLEDHHEGSVLTVTGSGGLGKSTLAKMLCCEEDVIGKFKGNIFFFTLGRTPKLITMVHRLFQHTGSEMPEFQSDDDAANLLENLLRKIGENPILLVLDDVWTESISLVHKFVFQIPNYIILMTSREAIRDFGLTHFLEPLDYVNAKDLFLRFASLNQTSSHDIRDDVEVIVRRCSGFPLALTRIGGFLKGQQPLVWHNMAKKLSTGGSILDRREDVLDCLTKSFEVLDPKVAECFKDLGLFPEAQRIRAGALIDIWAELPDEDDDSAMEKIYELLYWNMADIVVTRNSTSGTIDYVYHYVTQHGLLRDLSIRQTSQGEPETRNRLIIDVSSNKLPEWWTSNNEHHIAARALSISTGEGFTSERCNLQPTEVEVLVLNLREKKHTLPMFMKKMNKLKVLIITNYDFYRAELENFELLDYLSDLKRIRLEMVSIPFFSKTGVQLKNLQKFSFFMCNVNEAFKNNTFKVSDVLPNLEEMNIDYCDMVELPFGLSESVSLKKLNIRNCHKLSSLSKGIGNLVNLESLRLTSCASLEELPDTITSLHNLKVLDISDCVSLSNLPENMGKLRSLERLNCKGCTRLNELPYSITQLGGLRDVVCDEETLTLWEPFRTRLSDLKIDVAQVDFNLNWLL